MEAQSKAPGPAMESKQVFWARGRALVQTQRIGKGLKGGHAKINRI